VSAVNAGIDFWKHAASQVAAHVVNWIRFFYAHHKRGGFEQYIAKAAAAETWDQVKPLVVERNFEKGNCKDEDEKGP